MSAKKSPAVLWYPGDWSMGTKGMSFKEKGAYMELLMMQFSRGHMTADMITREVGSCWGKIKEKFRQDEDGLWYNERMEEEIKKRKKFVDSRYNNRDGKNQYNKDDLGHMTPHMENDLPCFNNNLETKKNEKSSKPVNFAAQGPNLLVERVAKEGLGITRPRRRDN